MKDRFNAGVHKMLLRIANREDPDLGRHCMSRTFGRLLVFKIFEHLPYLENTKII